jgi:C-terminal processing protease CtpA/Prc
LLEGAWRGLVAALDDPYVRYLTPEEAAADVAVRRDPNVVVTGAVGDLGYLRVTSFDSERAGERFATELDGLIVRGVRALVLDLRGNDGGLVLSGLQVLDRLLSDVVLGYRMGARTRVPLGFANPNAVGRPVAVLVDDGTASTAEIVAGALQTYGRARLYGSVTAGKGVGQTSVALSDGGELRLVTFGWALPDGRSIDGWGLTPDVPVRGDAPVAAVDLVDVLADPARDPVLAAALAALRRTLGDDLTDDGLSPVEPRAVEPTPVGTDR